LANEPGSESNDIIFLVVVIGPDTNSYTNNGTDKNGDKPMPHPNDCDASRSKRVKKVKFRFNLSERCIEKWTTRQAAS